MALTDENGVGTTMLVQPSGYGMPYYGGGFGGGLFGGNGGNDWLGLLFLIALCNGGWGGFGGFGGWGGMMGMGMMDGFGLYPWLNNSQHISDGFRDQQLNTQVGNLQNTVTSGFGDVQLGIAGVNQNICQTGNSITGAINNGFASAEIAANGRQMANMQQAFANQQAMSQGFWDLSRQQADCCCENRLGLANLNATIASEECATRANSTQNTQSILNMVNAGIQSIKDQLCQDKIDEKNDTIAQLRSELLYSRGQASQDVQTAAIQAGQRALANEVEQYVAPRAIPSYIVQNPNCCYGNTGCGCGSF
ncbi:MAG: hypothetical protein IJ740_08315 [Ruminococcus sp.]|nr:hypothetical protein [Ruminococcus sp.]